MSTDALVVHTVAVPDLRMGSASWDGKSLVAEVSVGEGGSIYRLGPLETLVLATARNPRTGPGSRRGWSRSACASGDRERAHHRLRPAWSR